MTASPPSKPRQSLFAGITILGSVLVFLIAVEIVLRLFPSLIGLAILSRFPDGLRREIGDRLNLPTASSRPLLPAEQRSDGGPDIYLFEKSATVTLPLEPADIALGAKLQVQTDANGFCNPSEKAMRGSNEIVMLGDSFTWCTAVPPDKTASALLEGATSHSVYDLGIPGVGPYEYLELLRQFGLKQHPRLVVMNIYEGNDLRDIVRYRTFKTSMAKPQRQNKDWTGWSYALSFLAGGVAEIGHAYSEPNLDFHYRIHVGERDMAMNVANGDQSEARDANAMAEGKLDPALYADPLAALAAMAKENDFKALLTYIPSSYTAFADSVSFDDRELGEHLKAFSLSQRQWLKDNAPRLGLNFIDLTPAMQSAVQKGILSHYPGNNHLTPEGQEIVAEAIRPAVLPLLDGSP